MTSQTVGYVRVSTLDQNTERQLEGVKLDKVFTDKASGKDTNRPQLQAALEWVREGDTLIVHSMDRLARNVEDMLRIVRELTRKGVSIRFEKESMTFSPEGTDPRNMLMFTMLSAFSQFERALIRERQREGIAIAKAKGIYKGRKPQLDEAAISRLRERVALGESTRMQIARDFGISRATLYKLIDDSNQRRIP